MCVTQVVVSLRVPPTTLCCIFLFTLSSEAFSEVLFDLFSLFLPSPVYVE